MYPWDHEPNTLKAALMRGEAEEMAIRPNRKPLVYPGHPDEQVIERPDIDLAKAWGPKFRAEVIGNEANTEKIINRINCRILNLSSPSRPVAIFLLTGLSGSGKTHTGLALAKALHGNANKMIRVDCGEYQHDHEIAKFIGSPPGYLGHDSTPSILSADRLSSICTPKCKYQVVLFDEIEKASDKVQNILLGVFDYGKITLGNNKAVDMTNTIILMTSNLGAKNNLKSIHGQTMTFDRKTVTREDVEGESMTIVKKFFRTEFLNRLDGVLVYDRFSAPELTELTTRLLKEFGERVSDNTGVEIALDIKTLVPYIVNNIYKPEYGAREIRRFIEQKLEIGIMNEILDNRPSRIEIAQKKGEVEIKSGRRQVPGTFD